MTQRRQPRECSAYVDRGGRTERVRRAVEGDCQALDDLLKRPHTFDDRNRWLHRTIVAGNVRGMEMLLNAGASTEAYNRRGMKALHVAAYHGRTACLRRLLERGVSVRQPTCGKMADHFPCALALACRYGRTTATQVLWDAERKTPSPSLLWWSKAWDAAVSQGHHRCVNVLLQTPSPFNDGTTHLDVGLNVAAMGGRLQTVVVLLRAGANVNQALPAEQSAVWRAAQGGHDATLKRLLKAGADAHARQKNAKTLLHAAVSGRSPACVETLCNAGVDVHGSDDDHETPLHAAAWLGCVEALGVLLRHGADPNRCNAADETPVHAALCGCTFEGVKKLLDAGGQWPDHPVNATTSYLCGKTMWDVVRENNPNLLAALIEHERKELGGGNERNVPPFVDHAVGRRL